jgi:hypothetical protein
MPAKKTNDELDLTPEYKLATKLLNAHKSLWVREMKKAGKADIDPVMYSRISIVALTQLAAMVGVDVMMEHQQFAAVCNAQFAEAYRRAPRFS